MFFLPKGRITSSVVGRLRGQSTHACSLILRQTSVALPRPRFYATTLETSSKGLVFRSTDSGTPVKTELSKIWLRDNCRCAQCVNQDTLQRNFDTFAIPKDISPTDIMPKADGVDISWSDSHRSHYPWSWLSSNFGNTTHKGLSNQDERSLWGATISSAPPEVDFENVMSSASSKGMAELTSKIRRYGLCFVANSPKTPQDTEKLLESIGPIRNTHYGGFYDFIPDLALADTAYTNLALPAHTDTTYFTEPAGLQSFHLLSHTPPANKPVSEVLGGQSLLVDGFHAAETLRRESPEDFDILRRVKLPWHASGNQGVAIAPDMAYPVIEVSGDKLHRIRWNNDDRGVVPLDVDVDAWYQAARKWDEILRRKEHEFWFQLEPGRVLIFDNWRVLHGRSAFEGLRRICGAYIGRDDFISRWKMTNFPREDVITSNMQLR
ncbi:Trimethyllysine dioxygenase [Trichoderma novae-zelandiae]